MATKTTGNLIPSNTNVPLDARARISSLEDMVNIGNPYIGLIVYVVSTGKLYVVTGLKSKEVDGVLVENAAVDTYEELEGISNIAIGGVTTVAATEQAHVEVVKTGTTATLHFAIPQGEDGKDGEQGIQGESGKDGITPSITVGDVTVVDNPEEANVTVADGSTDVDVILNFAIPRGPAGEGGAADLTEVNNKLAAISESLEGVNDILETIVGPDNVVVGGASEDDIVKALLIWGK